MLLSYFIFHSIISILYVLYFILVYEVQWTAMILHLVLISLLHLPVFILISIKLNSYVLKKWQLFISAFYISLYWFCLIAIYSLNWFSNKYWGTSVYIDFIKTLPKQIEALSNILNISSYWVYLSMLLIFFILCFLALKLMKASTNIIINNLSSTKPSVYSSIFLVIGLFYINFTYSSDDPDVWMGEPIINTLTLESDVYNSPNNKIERLKDAQIRDTFKSNDIKKPTTNVVIIMVDSLRGDRLSINGYYRNTTPFLSDLKSKNKLQTVNYFTSTCSESTCGVYSTLSSRRASFLGGGLYDLSDVLKDSGYYKNFILSARHNYNGLDGFYGEEMDLHVDGLDFKVPYELYQDEGVIYHLNKAPKYDGKTPTFMYLHLMSAHQAGNNLSEFNVFKPYRDWYVGNKAKDKEDAIKINNTYDNGILQTDNYIKRIFEILESKSYLDDALVIITGDHGEGMGERDAFSHTWYLYNEDINIPFILYSSEAFCKLGNIKYGTQIDIAPTILDCLDLLIPESWQGRSLLKPYIPNRITYHQTIRNPKEVMVVKENEEHFYKLMGTLSSGQIKNYRLYDWYQDKKEQINLIESIDQDTLDEMKKLLKTEFN